MPKDRKQFKKVYFVIQTIPHFSVCGYCFNKKEAEEVAKYVNMVTGTSGRVISFTRKQIQELNFNKGFVR